MTATPIVTFAAAGTLHAFDTPNCDAWVIENCTSFDDFIAIYDEKSATCPDHHILSSFDDYNQACYTSGHAMQKYDLDPPCDENIKALSSREKYDATFAKFMGQTGTISFANLRGRLRDFKTNDEEQLSLLEVTTNPDFCLDAQIVMQIVPVSMPEDALSVFPNGYFQSDLTPFENHALAAHLREHHNLKLIAIGASYLCFLRDAVLTEADAISLARDIAALGDGTDATFSLQTLAAAIVGKRHLILPYACA